MKDRLELEDVISIVSDEIKTSLPGSKERSDSVNQFVDLYKLFIDEKKIDLQSRDLDIREDQISYETELKDRELEIRKEEIKENKIEKELRNRISVGDIVNWSIQIGLPIIGYCVYDKWYKIGLNFEKTGTITTPQTRKLVQEMFPRKKF